MHTEEKCQDLAVVSTAARSRHHAQKLRLQDELALLVLLRALKCLVVLPPNHLFALSARDISYDVSAGGHVAVARFRSLGVHDAVEEVGFAMLTTEILWSVRQFKIMCPEIWHHEQTGERKSERARTDGISPLPD